MADDYAQQIARQLATPTLKPGPAPTGRDKVFDGIYGFLGGKPEHRWAADKLTDVVDYGTLGMLTGAYDGGREIAETGRPASLAMALMPGAKPAHVAGKAASAAGREVVQGIRGYHASPHDFEGPFDLSKAGTGNGYAAFGQGVNLSSTEDGARRYGKHMYEVKVNAPEDTFLNWDAPISEQSAHVQKAAGSLLPGHDTADLTGQGAAVMSGPFSELRERLMGVGINGVTHDMPKGQGRVVFDPGLIEILRKYGLLPPAAAGAAAASSPDQAQAAR